MDRMNRQITDVKRESDESGEAIAYHFSIDRDCVQVVAHEAGHWELQVNGDWVADLGSHDHPEGVLHMVRQALIQLGVR